MKRRGSSLASAALLAVALIGAATPLHGQGIAFGVQGSVADHAGFGIGPRVMLDLGPLDLGFRLVGSAELFFPDAETFERSGTAVEADDVDYWEANLNVVYTLGLPVVPLTPYLGGGLNFAGIKVEGSPDGLLDIDETDAGVNVLAGLELRLFGVAPFFEGRYTFGGGDQWVLTGGITF
jgi:hypothetical protein